MRAVENISGRHLFFYGVLLGEVASARIGAMLAGLGPGRPAVARGTLYAVQIPSGWYPVLLAGEGPAAHPIRGMVHEAGSVDIAALDRFEGVDSADPHAGEYRREPISITPYDAAPLMADAYLYNHAPAPAFEPIPHGDFARWLRETGRKPLADR